MTLGEMLGSRAAANGAVPALICMDRSVTYAELDIATDRLAAWLLAQGLKPGDRVALQWPNTIEAVELYFAIFKAGLIAVPLNLRLKPGEIAWILENSGAALCFSHPRFVDGIRSLGREALTALPDFSATTGALPPVDSDAPAAIVYTSGSTGKPKGAVHTHRSLVATARACTHDFGPAAEVERGLAITPLMHASGIYVLFGSFYLTQTCVLLPLFEPGAVLDCIEKYRCTITMALPALMQFVLEEQTKHPRDVSSLKLVFAGGDTVPVALQERARELLGVELLEGLAQTETGPSLRNPIGAGVTGSLGKCNENVEVRVVDAAGCDLPDGVTGELLVRSACLCTGYWNNPEATAEAIRDGWFHTGDLVSRDENGYYWFRGRLKEIIIRGGSNISPQEVEEALYSHPEILEAGVVGLPHAVWGEQVVAVVALREGATADEESIQAHARGQLADYKVPERIHFLPVLPKGATGKVHRKSLKDHLLETERGASNTR